MTRTLSPTEAKAIQNSQDRDGTVAVFDLIDRRWVRVASVDAREMVDVGSASYHGPSVQMKHKDTGQEILVAEVEVEKHLGRGWVVHAETQAPPAEAPASPDDLARAEQRKEFEGLKVGELRELAESSSIENFSNMSKAELVQALLDRSN